MASAAAAYSPITTLSTVDPLTSRTRTQTPSRLIFYNLNPRTDHLKDCRNLQEIKQLHGQLTKQGTMNEPAILANLIAKCAQMGSSESLECAQKAFGIFKENSNGSKIFLYNSLIRGNSSAGLFHEALMFYVEMVVEGVEPDNYTFPFVLSACAKSLRLFEGLQIHASIMKMGFHSDVFVLNSLIYLYGECGEIDRASKVFDEMPERNVVSWTSLICAYASRDRHQEAVSLFFEMIEDGVKPNEVTMVSVISACAKLGDFVLGSRVSEYVGWSGLTVNAVMVNALVDMYMKCGAAETAKKLFDECDDRNLVLYNTVISNYVRLEKVDEAIAVFLEMIDIGPKPDRVSMLSVISASAELGHFHFGMQCHAYVLRNGLEGWDNICNSLIDMYTMCGKQEWACRVFDQMLNKIIVSWNSLLMGFARNKDLDSARESFNKMPERNLISWNSMIGALVQQSFFADAIELFHSMQIEGITADKVTMASVASACGYLGALDHAKWVHNYIERHNIHCDMWLSTALVDMFARCGDSQSAMKVFCTMKERDVSTWTAAIGAMAMEGNGRRAVDLFHEMLGQGVVPDEVVFAGVLTACSHSGLVDEGMRIFNSMKEHRVHPHIVHYGCIVDLLGRAGLLDEALNFIKSMPMDPNDEIWSAFLAACRIHKNEKMATHVVQMVNKSATEKAGIQVLLSNVYAAAGKWGDVANVRMQMKEKTMRKIPGSSSIEIDGAVHEFTSGDESHPQNGIISSMLEEINCRLGGEGYVPDLTNVLLYVHEQEKGFLLIRHSEKLAIAFGLVSSAKGMPVRVVKNLRMCSDCHSFAKMVSRVYDREIVIRDNNRYHFFRQGLCSCGDYW